jgi:hypothetical protein
MSKKILMDAFYNQFADFLSQLAKTFPEDPDFSAYKTGLLLFQKTNPVLVIKTVHEHVAPYEETIRAKNVDFFLKHDYSGHIDNDDAMEQVIQKLKGYWSEMSPANQEVVWKYITLLLDLAKRYTSG